VILNNFFYSFINKIRVLSLIIIRFLNIRFSAKEPNENPYKIIKNGDSLCLIPKKIWLFWHDDNFPVIVSECVDKILKLNKDFEVILLNDSTVCSYVLDIDKYNFPEVQHRSDYIRLYVLNSYGGVWIDASIMCFKGVDLFLEELDLYKSDFFAFFNERRTKDISFPVLENWFLIANRGNKFISNWLEEYRKALEMGVIGYLHDVEKNNPEFFHKISKEERPYLFSYICAQRVLRDYSGSYVFWSCNDTAFYYHMTGSWRYLFFGIKTFHYTNIVKTLTLFRKPKKTPILIKLVAGDRHHINILLEKSQYKKDTLMDVFLNGVGD
jgi:hypothetical protein